MSVEAKPSMPTRLKRWAKSLRVYPHVHVARHAGVRHLLARGRIARQIDDRPPIRTRPSTVALGGGPVDVGVDAGAAVEIHVLVYAADVRMALWSLRSFYHYAGVDWPLVIHQGGRMAERDWALLRRHFPNAALVPAAEADPFVERELQRRGLPRAAAIRRGAVMFRKFDPLLLSSARSVLLLDSDVLFLAPPQELTDAAARPDHPNLYNRDSVEFAYNLGPDRARDFFGIDLPSGVNAGLALLRRESIPLARLEEYLAEPSLMSRPHFVEQTLHGLLAGEIGCEFLPGTYACSTAPGLTAPDGRPLVAKHYIQTPRPLLFEEGMPELLRRGAV